MEWQGGRESFNIVNYLKQRQEILTEAGYEAPTLDPLVPSLSLDTAEQVLKLKKVAVEFYAPWW